MDASIRQLPSSVSKLLCSTQVITSPTSVIKELIENALDAGATNIDVKLESFGLDRIEVRDNGCGIKLQDTHCMALPHCTSKICCESDLAHISTYGFRGEALSSICSIGEVTISTRFVAEETGTTFKMDSSGNVISQNPCSLNQGTCVIVTKLFKNVPVRRQYYSTMVKKKEETKNVEELLRGYAVVRHEVRLSLYHNKCLIWQKGRSVDLKSSLQQVLGISVMNQMDVLYYKNPDNQVQITAFLPKAKSCIQTTGRIQPDMTFIFVNQRPVKHKAISQMLKQYYSTNHRLTSSCMKYPTCCLCIQVPSDTVDVNVDPSKSQVLFHNKDIILTEIESMLGNMYGESLPASKILNTEENEKLQMKEPSETRRKQELHQPLGRSDVPVASTHFSNSQSCSQSKNVTAKQNPDIVFASELSTSETLSPVKNSEDITNNVFRDVDIIFDSQDVGWDSHKSNPRNSLNGGVVLDELVKSVDSSKCLLVSEDKLCHHHNEEQIVDVHDKFAATQWSLGCVKGNSGEIVKPPQIFVGAAKRNLMLSRDASEKGASATPAKKKQKSLDTSSVTLDDYFKSSMDTEQQTQMNADQIQEKDLPKKTVGEAQSKKTNNKCKKLHMFRNKSANDSAQHKQKLVEISERFIKSSAISAPQLKMAEINFKIDEVRKTLNSLGELTSSSASQSQCSPSRNVIAFVGKLDNGFWIVHRNGSLEIIHHHRINETLLYHNLMASHRISVHPLEMPTVLTESHLGEVEWKTLLHLSLLNKGLDSVSSVTDERIAGNGFAIKRYDDVETGNITMHLVGVANHIPYYGVNDLKECLNKIGVNLATMLQQCRPLKVSHYLKGEAIRMSRGQVFNRTKNDLQSLLQAAEQHLPHIQKCLHGLPFFTAIYNMETLPEILEDDV